MNEQVLAIPHSAQQVLLKALAKIPHQRFARVQDFADALEQAYSNHNYDQAYNDLGTPVTKVTTRDQFIQRAQGEDRCYESVTHYTAINAGTPLQGNTLSYNYTITRGKLAKPYQLYLTLQQGSSGNWQITDYNSNRSQPSCSLACCLQYDHWHQYTA